MAPLSDLLRQLLSSRLASLGLLGGTAGLVAAAVARLIPWWLFLVLLLVAAVGVVAFVLLRQWWGARKDASLMGGLDSATQRDVGQRRVRDREAVKDLQTKWKESVEALKKSRIGRQRRFLYHLPWYVIIGAPACGKSTAIKNSGLHFPMGEPKLGGTGGTKNCDWWFAEEAILLDTAGRYTFGDEQAPDQEEWLAFLRLLHKYRPISPINGLIIAVSADGMMTKDREEVAEDARNIREKLDQLVRELGIQFPIYLLVTKCDLVEGFTDFFGRLPRKRLDEMLGWTNPSWEMTDPPKLVETALTELRERMLAMRINFLWEEERPDALRKIYLFPEEMRVFERSLAEFCDVLLRETRYNESPFLRGIYLTSGMQTGTAVSRMLERLGLRAQATELREEKRSYFLKELFQGRLSEDRSLVATSGHKRGQTQVFNNLAIGVVAAVCVLFAILTGGSYIANRTLLLDVEDEMRAAAGPEERPPAERVAALGRYVDALERLEDRNRRRPLSAGWGLYTGYRAIEPARQLFLTRFEKDAYLPAVDGARQAIRGREPERGFAGLEALIRNYVLSKLLNGTAAEAPGSNDALTAFWSRGAALDGDLLKSYRRGYLYFLRWRGGDTARAEQANDLVVIRDALPEMYTVERVAAWADRLYPAVKAQDIPVPAAVASGAVVRGAFTPEAWNERIVPLTDAIDLVAADIDPALTARFRQQYQARYYGEWLQFVLKPKVAADGAVPTTTLLGEKTPYLAIVTRVAAATAIDGDEKQRPAWVGTVGRVATEKTAYLGQLEAMARQVRAAEDDPEAALPDAKGIFVRRPRAPLDGGDENTLGVADAFGKTEQWVEKAVAPGAGVDPEDEQVRTRLTALLRAPVYDAFGTYLRPLARDIDRVWRERIAERFAEASTPTAIEALYARNGGQVWAFFTEFLDPFLERPGYAAKVRYTKRMPLTADLPVFLNGVDAMNGVLFGPGGGYRKQSIMFETVPSEDPGEGALRATRTVLSVFCEDAEPWRLEHRQFRVTKQLSWSPGACQRTELTVFVGAGGGEERPLEPIVADGPMGLLTLLTRATRRGNQFSWTLPGNITASYVITLPDRLLALAGGARPPATILQ